VLQIVAGIRPTKAPCPLLFPALADIRSPYRVSTFKVHAPGDAEKPQNPQHPRRPPRTSAIPASPNKPTLPMSNSLAMDSHERSRPPLFIPQTSTTSRPQVVRCYDDGWRLVDPLHPPNPSTNHSGTPSLRTEKPECRPSWYFVSYSGSLVFIPQATEPACCNRRRIVV